MKIALKQYLTSLKESKELDAILPDLLFSMGINVEAKPQVGVRQNGVDIFGINNKEKELYILVIKQGNIGRQDWDGNPTAIRSTLDEILDIFIPAKEKEFSKYKFNVVLCTGGDLLQEVNQNWHGYIEKHKKNNLKYLLWDGDRLAELFYDNLFNENILIPEYRSLFRKALSLVSEPSYNLSEFYKLIDLLLNNIQLVKVKNSLKYLQTTRLVLKIFIQWSIDENNYKHAINAAEYSVLKIWDTITENKFLKNKKILQIFYYVYLDLLNLLIENNNRFTDLYQIKNGLHGFTKSGNAEVESLAVFEQLGILALLAIMLKFQSYRVKTNENDFENVLNNLVNLILNHNCLLNPLFDSHAIEISMAAFVLFIGDKKDFLSKWIKNIVVHIDYAYKIIGKYFPTFGDDFTMLINENEENKQENFCLSTLFCWLLDWACILNDNELYDFIKKIIEKDFSKTFIEQWYPDKTIDSFIYNSNAGYKSGFTNAYNPIPQNIEKMKSIWNQKSESSANISDFSCFINGVPELIFISNRHFRTPIVPCLIRETFKDSIFFT